ncbi:hypothetical protein BVRB_8g192060 [Beta vulgaris subsp. vulgaris]|nr:hypothetical protein BVRB_8g192060 [Beta vulgaris subsp. vulgaris]
MMISTLCAKSRLSRCSTIPPIVRVPIGEGAAALAMRGQMRSRDGVTLLLELFKAWEHIGVERIAGLTYLAWSIWYKCNQLVFKDQVIANSEFMVRSGNMKADYVKYTSCIHRDFYRRR